MVYALLIDNGGSVLLVRRRGSALWSLPGGELRAGTDTEQLLTSYCQRQTGIIPENLGPLQVIALAGTMHGVAIAHVLRTRAGARGRIEAIHWAHPQSLPIETNPVARMAVATLSRQLIAERTAQVANHVLIALPVSPSI